MLGGCILIDGREVPMLHINANSDICGIEFYSDADLESCMRRNPALKRTVVSDCTILLFRCADFPTRDIEEIFNADGSLYATLLGPDALEEFYHVYHFDWYLSRVETFPKVDTCQK
jgi:hypothetical protein